MTQISIRRRQVVPIRMRGLKNHKRRVMEHNLVVSGVHVSERKERTAITQEDINGTEESGHLIKTVLVHTRTIGDRAYTLKETKDKDGKVVDSSIITAMSADEVNKFEADWKDYWIPTISDELIESGEFEALPKEVDEKVLQFDSVDRVSAGISDDSHYHDEKKSDAGIIDTKGEGNSVEEFVRSHPLEVFYFGIAMLLIAVVVIQCCFLPEYPPCSWIKDFMRCILECVEEANAGES